MTAPAAYMRPSGHWLSVKRFTIGLLAFEEPCKGLAQDPHVYAGRDEPHSLSVLQNQVARLISLSMRSARLIGDTSVTPACLAIASSGHT
jgi:hypothetical protein